MNGTYETIEWSVDGRVALIRLKRPDRSNAFDATMVKEMEEVFPAVVDDPDVGALVITGSGRAFCAGGDVRYMRDCVSEGRIDDAMTLVYGGCRVVRAIHRSPIPVIAAVNGAAVGGGASLAFACDLRIAAEGARFHLTYTKLGLAPAWGGSYFIPRLVGPAKGVELLWRGATIDSGEGLSLGLLNRVVPEDRLMDEAMSVARELVGQSREALSCVKEMAWSSLSKDLDSMLSWEEDTQRKLFATDEVRRSLDEIVKRMDEGNR